MLTTRNLLLLLLLLIVGALAATGCGIGPVPEHHEPLAQMRVTGERTVGQEMRLELDYAQTYNVAVDVECDLEQGGKVVEIIGFDSVPANPSGRPDATPAAGTLSFPFTVEEAGSYSVVCFTRKDTANSLTVPLSITD